MIKLGRVLLGIGVMGVFSISSALAYQVLTNHNNVARTGWVSNETGLTPANAA
jgi:hypothetical protein